jgi:DNA-binding response OmpR family regulator
VNERILVVQEDPRTADGVALALRDEGFEVESSADGSSALERARAHTPDLIVLDVGHRGGMSAMEVCHALRGESGVPILMLSARDTEVDTVLGLERGADDYMTKPFSLVEVIARVRALLRGRALARASAQAMVREVGALRIDLARHEVSVEGNPVHTTPSEFRLLALLAERLEEAVSRSELCMRLWGTDRSLDTRACDLHVARLRRKIEADPTHPRRLLTVRGVGYKLVPSPPAGPADPSARRSLARSAM